MARFNFFQAIWQSFYSRPLYHDVAANWHGSGHGYLLLVLLVTWIPMWAIGWIAYRSVGERSVAMVARQTPWLNINDGKLELREKNPHQTVVMTTPYSKTPLIVIDTAGNLTSIDQTSAHIFATTDELQFRLGGHTFASEWPQWLSMQIGVTRLKFIGYVGRRVFIPATYTLSFFYRATQNLAWALVGLMLARFTGVRLTFRQLRRLAIVAITPAMVLTNVWLLLACPWPKAWFILAPAITLAYLCFAIRAADDPHLARLLQDAQSDLVPPADDHHEQAPAPTGGPAIA